MGEENKEEEKRIKRMEDCLVQILFELRWIQKKYESTSQLFFNYDCVNHHFRNSDDYTNPLIRRVKMVVAIAVIIGRKTELARR